MLPVTTHGNGENQPTGTGSSLMADAAPKGSIFNPTISILFFYLTFNCISTFYQACIHGDFAMAAFIVFVYFGYFLLMYCIKQLQDLSPDEDSPRKDLLKCVVWCLISTMLFGFCYELATFIHPVVAVLVFALTVWLTCILFVYFVHHGCQQQQQQSSGCCCRLGIKIIASGSPNNQVNSYSKIVQTVTDGQENKIKQTDGLENV